MKPPLSEKIAKLILFGIGITLITQSLGLSVFTGRWWAFTVGLALVTDLNFLPVFYDKEER